MIRKKKSRFVNAGFGLLELMVAMVLGIILSLGVVEIYINSKRTFDQQEGLSRLQENARYAMNRIFKSASGAGYMGCLSARADNIAAVQTNTLSNQNGNFDFSFPVFGVENGTLDSLTFKRMLGFGGIPLVEDMEDETSSVKLDPLDERYSNFRQFDLVMIGDCEHASIFMITNDPQSSGGQIEHKTGVPSLTGQSNSTEWLNHIYMRSGQNTSSSMVLQAQVVTYSIQTGTAAAGACSAINPGYCSLFERVNDGLTQELVQGVHGLDVLYGEDLSGDTQADVYRSATNVIDWSRVVSVQVTLSFNTVKSTQASGQGDVTTIKNMTQVFRLRSRGV